MAISYLIWLVVGAAFAYWAYRAALGRGRSPQLWTILGFLFGLIAIAILYVMPNRKDPETVDAPTEGPDL